VVAFKEAEDYLTPSSTFTRNRHPNASPGARNPVMRYLRAVFNYGLKRALLSVSSRFSGSFDRFWNVPNEALKDVLALFDIQKQDALELVSREKTFLNVSVARSPVDANVTLYAREGKTKYGRWKAGVAT
jgi:hypothetical protein